MIIGALLGGLIILMTKISPSGFIYADIDIRPRHTVTMDTFRFKVDTGANCTTISIAHLIELGYDEAWILKGKRMMGRAAPVLASGEILKDCYEVILPEIRIGSWVGYNWPFITSLSKPFKLLLGTNSLKFFNWKLDYDSLLCTFELRKNQRNFAFNESGQSIHAIGRGD